MLHQPAQDRETGRTGNVDADTAHDSSGLSNDARNLLVAVSNDHVFAPLPRASPMRVTSTILPVITFALSKPVRPNRRGNNAFRIAASRSEEHKSELQSLMRTSYTAF